MQSLTIPFEVRGSVSRYWSQYLIAWVSVWRFTETGYYRVREIQSRWGPIVNGNDVLRLDNDNDLRQYTIIVTPAVYVEVFAKDILGFGMQCVRADQFSNSVPIYQHYPLLYKPGPSPAGTFTPILSVNFTASSGPATGELN